VKELFDFLKQSKEVTASETIGVALGDQVSAVFPVNIVVQAVAGGQYFCPGIKVFTIICLVDLQPGRRFTSNRKRGSVQGHAHQFRSVDEPRLLEDRSDFCSCR
jgi:hypothetical protein